MGKTYDFDYIVIGGGSAGITAATSLANAKKRVALVEGQNLGGSNLNSRDIPYGVSLRFAHAFSELETFPEINGQDLYYNFPSIVSHQQQVVGLLRDKVESSLLSSGAIFIPGYANFLDTNTIAVGDQKYTSKYFILATGSKLKTTNIAGLDTVNYLTPNTALKIRRLPRFAFVVGGGASGCEIAEYFAELGIKVILMERASRLLPKEDKEVGEEIKNYFTNRLGMIVITSAKVVALSQEDSIRRVIFNDGKTEKMVRIDCVVLATGAAPVTDYGLENAHVKYTSSGIRVNNFFQTTAKNIYAIGDAIGGESATERAEYQASVLTSNLLNHTKTPIDYTGFVRSVSTYPEIATVGLNEETLIKNKQKYKKSIVYLNELPAAKINRLEYGFVKILANRSGRILGSTLVAPNASLMAAEFSIAIRNRLNILELASTPHISNSTNYAIKLAAKQLATKK